MHPLFSSIPVWINQFQDHFARSFSNKISPQAMKVIAVTALIFAMLGLLIYGIYRRHLEEKEIIQQPDDQSEIVQKVQNQSLLIAHSPQEKMKKEDHLQPALVKPFIAAPSAFSAGVPPLPKHDYAKLFDQLDSQTRQPPSLPFSPANCRFNNILCPIETHANHVHLENLHFILTQYPLPDRASLFWRACEQACLIVDLTNQDDMRKGLAPYAPNLKDIVAYGEVSVNCKEQETLAGINARLYTYSLTNQGKECEIPRLHYEGWNDFHGITEDDLDRIIAVCEYYQKDATQPIILHCRAGVGRSGTLAVAFALSHLIRQNKVTVDNLHEHLSRLILEGRQQRGPGFVQTEQQLEAIWRWSWRALHRGLFS